MKGDKDFLAPLNAMALAAVETMRSRGTGTGRVFPHENCRHWFATCLRHAGITDFHWHDLRHTFASRLVMLGESLYTVSKLMAHANIAMTQRYAHLAPHHLQSAVDRLTEISTPVAPSADISDMPTLNHVN